MKTEKNTLVYEIVDGKTGFEIEEKTLENLAEKWRDETTTPKGVDARIYVRGNQVRSWGAGGNYDHLVAEFETEEEAEAELFEIRLAELQESAASWMYSRDAAVKLIDEIASDGDAK